ncbi:MAG: hypothetical protein P4N24_20030 [Acidobacteriota bacterium]|nr:hypothetical protein [Acidobacteriota bacterium]
MKTNDLDCFLDELLKRSKLAWISHRGHAQRIRKSALREAGNTALPNRGAKSGLAANDQNLAEFHVIETNKIIVSRNRGQQEKGEIENAGLSRDVIEKNGEGIPPLCHNFIENKTVKILTPKY